MGKRKIKKIFKGLFCLCDILILNVTRNRNPNKRRGLFCFPPAKRNHREVFRFRSAKEWSDDISALEPYFDLITELFESGKTHAEISTALQRFGAPQCSVMTVRRFCLAHNLRRRNPVSDTELETAVISSIYRVCESNLEWTWHLYLLENIILPICFNRRVLPMAINSWQDTCLQLACVPGKAGLGES